MSLTFHPNPVNDPFGDPALYIPFFYHKRALLFDLGDLTPLAPKDILKITHAFVTHTHMDHFVGFDMVLRLLLGRNKHLHLFGPPFFLNNVEGKLAGYTWNLVNNYKYPLSLSVTEIHPDHTLTKTYPCANGFRPLGVLKEAFYDGTVVQEDAFQIHAIHLDHKIPCLAFKLQERFHMNIIKDGLLDLGLPVGPWLGQLKDAIYRGEDLDSPFTVAWKEDGRENKKQYRLGTLMETLVRKTPGQMIVYVVDVGYTTNNIEKIVSFAKGADQLFIEGAFLDKDKRTAEIKHHLTAKQAGTLARMAEVKHFTLMHFSSKYRNTPQLLIQEAQEAFSAP